MLPSRTHSSEKTAGYSGAAEYNHVLCILPAGSDYDRSGEFLSVCIPLSDKNVREPPPTFGGINLEDIKSPECFEIEETLERELDIPVFHDDQHGTAIVVTAALINALRVVGKKMEDVHIVLNGPGAAGTAIIKMLMTAGARDIIAVDQFGTLYKGCNSAEAHKNWLGEVTNPRQIKGGLKEALAGADVFIGVSKPGILTTELCRTMNKDAIVFAMEMCIRDRCRDAARPLEARSLSR